VVTAVEHAANGGRVRVETTAIEPLMNADWGNGEVGRWNGNKKMLSKCGLGISRKLSSLAGGVGKAEQAC
jgi:hypothetical protein